MNNRGLAIVIMAALSSSASASTVCDDLAKAVEDGVKEMAYYDEAPLGTSDVKLISRSADRVAEAVRIQSNLTLLQANKCQMPKTPINPRVYFESAFSCVHATPKPGAQDIPECNRDKWVRKSK